MPAIVARDDKNQITGWVGDPDGRGTLGLILSCVLTLGLCVWSALHLNIPPKGESKRNYWIRNIRWVILGVLIPELVVLAAWRQWSSAHALTQEVKRILQEEQVERGEKRGSVDHIRKHEWTTVHSFYAGMGGFVFEISHPVVATPAFIPDVTRLTLTAKGVALLAKTGHLPDIDKDDIKDKSKADGLAKAIVLLQAGWMLLQCIGRIAAKLPVSLLEVNTIGHIICAFVIYILWWHKPREVHEPTVLSGDWANELCAYMYMSSRISGTQLRRRGLKMTVPNSWIQPELSQYIYIAPEDCQQVLGNDTAQIRADSNDRETGPVILIHSDTAQTASTFTADKEKKEYLAQTTSDDFEGDLGAENCGYFQQHLHQQDTTMTAARKRRLGWREQISEDTIITRKRRHRLAARAVRNFTCVAKRFTSATTNSSATSSSASPDCHASEDIPDSYQKPLLDELVIPRSGNWPSDYLLPGLAGQKLGMSLWFASMAYGGVHVAAWRDQFPTAVEKLLWHMSSGYIVGAGFFWFVMNVLGFLWPWADEWWVRFLALKSHWWTYVFIGFGATCCGLFYIFSRIYLVLEAVISLRAAPKGVYETVDWISLIPHL